MFLAPLNNTLNPNLDKGVLQPTTILVKFIIIVGHGKFPPLQFITHSIWSIWCSFLLLLMDQQIIIYSKAAMVECCRQWTWRWGWKYLDALWSACEQS
jgi:hypothetical protein